jgi:hypothetical protein
MAYIIVRHVSNTQIRIDSGAGFVAIQFSDGTLKPKWIRLSADHFVGDSSHTYATEFPKPNRSSQVWGHFELSYAHTGVCVPYWFLLTSFAALAAAPWFPWRFSLRNLFIATTLVAVVLGLLVYAASK